MNKTEGTREYMKAIEFMAQCDAKQIKTGASKVDCALMLLTQKIVAIEVMIEDLQELNKKKA